MLQLYIKNDRCYADGQPVSWRLYMKLVALEDDILSDFVLEELPNRLDGEIVRLSVYREVKSRMNDRRLLRLATPRCQALGCSNPLPKGRRKFCCDQCGSRQRVQEHRQRQKLDRVRQGRKIIDERESY